MERQWSGRVKLFRPITKKSHREAFAPRGDDSMTTPARYQGPAGGVACAGASCGGAACAGVSTGAVTVFCAAGGSGIFAAGAAISNVAGAEIFGDGCAAGICGDSGARAWALATLTAGAFCVATSFTGCAGMSFTAAGGGAGGRSAADCDGASLGAALATGAGGGVSFDATICLGCEFHVPIS